MLMREKIRELLENAASKVGLSSDLYFDVGYAEAKFGDYASNIALVGSKQLKVKPQDLADKIVANLDQAMFENVSVAGPGFINFKLKLEALNPSSGRSGHLLPQGEKENGKILLEYFQPNIAKPLHIGHFRTAIIGDSLKRMMKFVGYDVESDTHMGDWGTQFGLLILAYKKHGDPKIVALDPITELNKLYVAINAEIEKNPGLHEEAKQEFVKLEQGDVENKKIWQQFVDWSMEKFMGINQLIDLLPFEHHWPESFYEDKMPGVLESLRTKKLLKESQGAQIVDLEDQKLGIAVIVKSDGGTTYLLRDLAAFIFVKNQGFTKHFYVVDNRQSHHYHQLFAILKLMGQMQEDEGIHIDYGFISFKGTALSTRKGNMVLAEDVLTEAENRVSKIIEEKNPQLPQKQKVIHAVSVGALKYFDLSHNRHSDIEFDWDKVLDFEGDSGPYLQYAYARLSSILKKAGDHVTRNTEHVTMTSTEREILFKLTILPEIVQDALQDYMPNVLANYLYNLATLVNKFYHESPVIAEANEDVKNFRLRLIVAAKNTLGQGLGLLGIEALEEM